MTKLLGKIFAEDMIGLTMIIAFAIAGIYSHTKSQNVQIAGLIFVSLIFVLLIGFVVKNVYFISISVRKWIKDKKGGVK